MKNIMSGVMAGYLDSVVNGRRVLVTLVYSLVLITFIQGESCERTSTCSCECSKGAIDLRSLDMKDGPRYKDEPDSVGSGFKYSWNPCSPFTESNGATFEDHCHDVAACQVIDLGTVFQFYDTGTQDSVEFYTTSGPDVDIPDEDEVVVAHYTSADGARQTEVVLVCNTDNTGTAFAVIGELPNQSPIYRMVLVSPLACYVNESLSAGSIMLIVFFSGAFMYVAGMLVYGKFVKKASGADLMPHREFWFAIPGLAKDGVFFIFRRSAVRSERVPLKPS